MAAPARPLAASILSVRALAVLIALALGAGIAAAGTRGDPRSEVSTGPTSSTSSSTTTSTVATTTSSTAAPLLPATTTPTTTRRVTATTAPRPAPTTAESNPPSILGTILFHSNRGSIPDPPTSGPVTPSGRGYNVWAIRPDGTGLRQLTTTSVDGQPDLSADGRRIAYVHGDNGVWRMDSDGSHGRPLASCPLSCGTPRWSPDGTRIAYVSYHQDEHLDDIVIMGADGSNPRTYVTPDVAEYGVSWSPDGSRLVTNAYYANHGLFLLDVASGAETKLLNEQADAPDWSPDGSLILWGDDHSRICTIRSDGTGLHRITPFDKQRLYATWSHDGSRIVFDFFPGNTAGPQLATMRPDGTDVRLLTQGANDDSAPAT
jgi:Tol biopolymer transport system component